MPIGLSRNNPDSPCFADAQENGTCATIWPLWNAKPEDMLAEDLDKGIMNAPPLALANIQLNESESAAWRECMLHTILQIIVDQLPILMHQLWPVSDMLAAWGCNVG